MMKSHSKDNAATPAYRAGVGIMLINEYGKVFVGQRHDTSSEAWQMPQGGIDSGETPHQALMRELEEEVGTNDIEIIAETKEWLYYDLPKELVKNFWGGKYVGQKQKWFLAKLLGGDSEINIQTEKPEFVAWKWVDIEMLPELIVPFKRELYKKIISEFSSTLGN